MRWRGQLSTKFLATGLLLLVLALLSIGLTMWVTRQLDGGAAAVNEAGRMRMQAWRLASAQLAGQTPEQVAARVAEFEASLAVLRDGDAQRPLAVPWNDTSRQQFQALQDDWHALRATWLAPAYPDGTALFAQVDAFVPRVDVFVNTIEATMARLTAVLNLFQFLMMALAVAAAVLSAYVGYLFVIHPLHRLRKAFQRVETGDFATRVAVDAPDEFGELAAGFNHMAQTLQSLYHGLEAQVAAKTRDIEAKRARLASLYEVSSFLVEQHSLEELAKGFAQKVRVLSGADAVAVRWSDEASQRYLMLASDCLPEELATEERCLEAGLCACGQPQATARTRVIPIIAADDRLLGNCVKAGYSALVSVPIRLQSRILGEIDLFYRREADLHEEDRALYDALAGHLANAIENLRTEALVREAAVSEERSLLARELHDSIAQSLAFLKIQVSLLRAAVARGDTSAQLPIIDEIDAGVRESTNDVRELLVHFRTRTNSDDIEQALRTTLKKFEHQSGLRTHLELNGHGVALPSDVQLQVLHVVQEALSNVRKHAAASEVTLKVDKGPRWRFEVRDNGQGFAPRAASASDTHVGLHIMRERAERIGAQVHVESAPGEGTAVLLELTQ
ncbi:MAG TPA: type IV pili methyl-accepting chemotaxis transducer N-terminal domain-containing protein [Burkholderiaceae bacterium]|nr:type IV pili methyl-accepting chemotaxis transducer N-terminal domain-containing protein [Burkholderiaceae bacterium]